MYRYLSILLICLHGNAALAVSVTPLDLWDSGSTAPRQIVDAGGYVVFEGERDNTFTDSVWRSDGTLAGSFVLETYGRVENFRGGRFFHHNGLTYYVADGDCVCGDPVGTELFVTDGTIDGTRVLKDINPDSADGIQVHFVSSVGDRVADLAAVGDTVFFVADDGERGNELWKTDGTEAGTQIVKDIFPGPDDSMDFPRLTAIGDYVFFFAMDNETNGTELWKSDGTEAGTIRVSNINPNVGESAISGATATDGIIAAVKDKLFWRGFDGTDIALWVSDGTAQGTIKLLDATSGSINSNNFMDSLTAHGDKLILRAQTTGNGGELWISDGTVAGTQLLANLRNGSLSGLISSTSYAKIGDELYFAAEAGNFGVELWKTDGTEAGTTQVININSSGDSDPEQIVNVNGTLYFSARVQDRDLYRSNGSSEGTFAVVKTDPNSITDLDPEYITVSGGGVFFRGYDPEIGDELFFVCCDGAMNHSITPVADVNGNGASELAVTSHTRNGVTRLRLNDGTSGELIKQPTFFGNAWLTNNVHNLEVDGANTLAVVATERSGFMGIQIKQADTNTLLRNLFPWSANWTYVDSAVVEDVLPSTGPAIAVLATRKTDGLMGVELRSPEDGGLIRIIYPLGLGWTPTTLQSLSVNGDAAIAVLATRDSDALTIVQVRRVSDGSLVKNVFPLGFGWLPEEFKIIEDLDGNGNDEVAVRMRRQSDGLDIIQIRDSQTANLIKNVYPIGAGGDVWQTQQFEVLTAAGNTTLAIVSVRDSDQQVLVQLKDPQTGAIVKNNFFIGAPWQFHQKAVVIKNFAGSSADEVAIPMRNSDTNQVLVQIRDGFDATVIRNVFVP